MKKMMMARMAKEYIWTKGMFEEYLDYMKKKIKEFYMKEIIISPDGDFNIVITSDCL